MKTAQTHIPAENGVSFRCWEEKIQRGQYKLPDFDTAAKTVVTKELHEQFLVMLMAFLCLIPCWADLEHLSLKHCKNEEGIKWGGKKNNFPHRFKLSLFEVI